MRVEQIAVFLENKSGRLAEITKILASGGVNIRALTVADTADFGILRLIVDKVDEAKQILKSNGFTVGKTNVIAALVDDEPGGLAKVLDSISAAGINVEYMYGFVSKHGDNAVLIFRFDTMDKAIEVLKKDGFTMLDAAQVCGI